PQVFVTTDRPDSAELRDRVPVVAVVGRDFEQLLDPEPMPGVTRCAPRRRGPATPGGGERQVPRARRALGRRTSPSTRALLHMP
ncbi:hypothetical protein, partial [Nocardia wallacei]|uniref:hypothetical protein n=1 Tax=Nocardia wallacei TaxID=480035 RepID=UPI00245737C6